MNHAELNEFVRLANEFDVIVEKIECDLAKELKVFIDLYGDVYGFKLLTKPSQLYPPLHGVESQPCLWFGEEVEEGGLKVKVSSDILVATDHERIRLLKEAVAVLIANEKKRLERQQKQKEDTDRREYERLKKKFGKDDRDEVNKDDVDEFNYGDD